MFQVLARHARSQDVEECQHPGSRTIDDRALEIREIPAARRAGVDHGRYARAESERIRKDAPIAARQHPALFAGEDVCVNID